MAALRYRIPGQERDVYESLVSYLDLFGKLETSALSSSLFRCVRYGRCVTNYTVFVATTDVYFQIRGCYRLSTTHAQRPRGAAVSTVSYS